MAIHNGYLTYEWQYVNRDDDNAEDDGSKSLKLDVMLKNDRQLKGPKFLGQDESHWSGTTEIPALTDDDPEVSKEDQIYAAAVQSCFEANATSFLSWKSFHLQKITKEAIVLREFYKKPQHPCIS